MIDLDNVVTQVRAIAAQKPNYTYDFEQCEYIKRGEGSCLIGQAMLRAGVEKEFFTPNNNDEGIGKLLRDEGFDAYDTRVLWLMEVQDLQDYGTEWGTAVEKADKEI